MRYVVYGAGTPIIISACSPEQAEMMVVDAYGADIDRLVTIEEPLDVLLSGSGDS